MRPLALALALALVGCISPRLVDEQPDPTLGWPTFLFQEDAGWCARGDGPWALWLREGASGLTIARDGTLTFYDASPEERLAGLAPETLAAWLVEAGFLPAGPFEAGRERVPEPDLAPLCTRLARDGPFLRGECELAVSTAMGTKRGCSEAILGAAMDLREGARDRLGLTRS